MCLAEVWAGICCLVLSICVFVYVHVFYIFNFIMVCTCNFYFHEYKKKKKKKKKKDSVDIVFVHQSRYLKSRNATTTCEIKHKSLLNFNFLNP